MEPEVRYRFHKSPEFGKCEILQYIKPFLFDEHERTLTSREKYWVLAAACILNTELNF